MTFLDGLKRAGTIFAGVEPIAVPIVSIFNPAAGALLQRIGTVVIGAEQSMPASAAGPQKSTAASAAFEDSLGMELAASIFEARGEKLTYSPSALQQAIDAQVALFNAVAALKASLGTEKKVV
jgi:hypothetical protein